MKPGLLFDLDGTLLDTAPDFLVACKLLCKELGLQAPDLFKLRQGVSNGANGILKKTLNLDTSDKDFDAIKARYLDIYEANLGHHTLYFPGIEALIDTLAEKDIPWGVVTNKPKRFTDPLMSYLKLNEKTHCFVSGDTLGKAKPHPDPILHACEMLDISPTHSVYVGDAKRDVDSSHAAGLHSIVANYGYIDEDDDPNDWKAHHYVDSAHDIYPIFATYL